MSDHSKHSHRQSTPALRLALTIDLDWQKAKGGLEALEDPEDALLWMVDLMDATLQRVDKAVDEGHKIVEKHRKVNFQARQVGLSPHPFSVRSSLGHAISPGCCDSYCWERWSLGKRGV